MRLFLEHDDDGVTVTLEVGNFTPFFLAGVYPIVQEKFGTIDVGGPEVDGEEVEEWTLLEINETGASLQDVSEFIFRTKDLWFPGEDS
jgi:hypothetical protein